MVGRRLLHFEILEKLGEGGMGVVYKARDTHLDRLVAIKVLPTEKVADPERRRRFVQEARAASALNHPHIITVHDITQAEGLDLIVMEHVEGKALDALIPRAGMRLSEVLKIGVQIAQALAAAHAKGIVHRDLKPANVMVGPGGAVKVLDFGLAKLNEPVSGARESQMPTGDARTGAGVILGTAAYMSPEQAEGKPMDARSDIFAFGALLYEMATGRRAFAGDSWASTISAVLSQEPKPLEGLPGELERIIHRCLRKDPGKRFQHMDDVGVALEELKEESDSGKLGAAAPPAPPAGWKRKAAYGTAAVCMLLAVAAIAWRFAAPAPDLPAPKLVPLTTFPGYESLPALSPDGTQVAFRWNGPKEDNYDIYVMLIGTATPLRLTTDPAPEGYPAWSPDGRSIAFVRFAPKQASVMLMSALGGSERHVAETTGSNVGIDWSPDGKYVAFPAVSQPGGVSQIVLVSPDTGERRVVTTPPPGMDGDEMPRFSPDGKTLAFLRMNDIDHVLMGVIPLADQKAEARTISPASASVFRSPFAWTRDGRELVFVASYQGVSRLWRMAADGQTPPSPVLGVGQRASAPAIAPQGGYLAYAQTLTDWNIWRLDLERERPAGVPIKVVGSTMLDTAPNFSPDGRRIVFASDRSGGYEIWVSGADGSNQTQVTRLGSTMTGSPRWSPDGRTIAFDSDVEGQAEIFTVSADGGPPTRLTTHAGLDAVPTWSRDGRWIYFASDRTGTRQLWKMPAEGGPAVQITRHGGVNATESADRTTLYYAKDIAAPGVWKMPVGGGEEVRVIDAPAAGRWGQMVLTGSGLYYIGRDGADLPARYAIFFHEFASRKTTRVCQLAKSPGLSTPGLSLSPDGRALLFTQFDASGSDLMLLQNFR